MPAVSVLMVFHRDTPYVRLAIASVRAQTLRDWELILVDNGTGLPAGELGELGRDPRLRWVRLPANQGIAAGHNAGTEAAKSAFIALLDHDDLMLPERLECQLALLRERPDLGLVGSQATTIDAEGRPVGPEFCLIEPAAHKAYSAFHSGAITPSFCGRTEIFRAFPYRPEFRWAADYDFVARVAERHGIAAVPRALLQYRRHAAQATRQHRVEQVREECFVRLLLSRRRRGRDEEFGHVATEIRSRVSPESEYEVHREFSRRFLAEGDGAQAVYQARRMVATGRNVRAAAAALRVFLRSVAREPRQRAFLSRLFFQGPVRAVAFPTTHGC